MNVVNISGSLVNPSNVEDCPKPNIIRLLLHPPTKRLVLLGGEWHQEIEVIKGKRFEDSLYFKILSQITRQIGLNKENSSPFHKVLFLSESNSSSETIELFGGTLDMTLFTESKPSYALREATIQMQKVAKRYPQQVLYRGTDIRKIIPQINQFIKYFLYGINKPTNEEMEKLVKITFGLLIQDQNLSNYPSLIVESSVKETDEFLEKEFHQEKKLSSTMQNTPKEYYALKTYFKKCLMQMYENETMIFPTDANYKTFYRPLFLFYNFFMELYTINYMLWMPQNTLSVFFGGNFHATKLFSLLTLFHGYKFIQTELVFQVSSNPCFVEFPATEYAVRKLVRDYNDVIETVTKTFDEATASERKIFLENILTYRYHGNYVITTPSFLKTLSTIPVSFLGTLEKYFSESLDKLFQEKILWEYTI